MDALPLIVLVLTIAALVIVVRRGRARVAERAREEQSRITVGSEVVTTSGLYGTVVAEQDEESVMLSIAPGVEVRWARLALREPAWLAAPPSDSAPDLHKHPHRDGAAGTADS